MTHPDHAPFNVVLGPRARIAYTANGFFITYRIENVGTLRVLNIGWGNPDYWG